MASSEVAAPAAAASDMSAAPAEPGLTLRDHKGQLLVSAFVGAHVTHHISNSLLNPLLPLIRDSFVLTYAQSGFLVSAFTLSLGLANAPMGMLADRIGSRPVVAAGLVLSGVVSAAAAFASGYWELFALLLLMGLIAGSYHAPSASILARAFPASVRGAAMGLHITGGHFSFFLTPLLAAWLVGMTGTWRTPYLWLAFAPVVFGLVLWKVAPAGREVAPQGVGRLAVFRDIGAVFKLVGPLVTVSIFAQMIHWSLFALTTLYLVDARGIDPLRAAVLSGMTQLAGAISAPLGGWLSDRIGRKMVIVIGVGGLGPSYLALMLIPTDLILLALLAIGAVGAMRGTVTETLVTESAPPHRRATILGGYYLLAQELGGVATPVIGVLAGAVGMGGAFLAASIGLAILSGVVLLTFRRL